MTIWKFPLTVTDRQTLRMPQGAEILSIQVQKDIPCIWALVDSQRDPETRSFLVLGTGHPAPSGLSIRQYIGTFQILSGSLVFHVFEVPHEAPRG